jgi:diaminopimelate epimerase
MSPISFAKYEALRNDFLVVAPRASGSRWTAERAAIFCDRRAGVGADGLIILGSMDHETVSFRLFNADGSPAEWSGNGVRCSMAYCHDEKNRREAQFMTGAGAIRASLEERKHAERWASFERPIPEVRQAKGSTSGSIPLTAGPYIVNAGNPHRVYLVKNFRFDWEKVGAECQAAARHTHGTNVEFVKVASSARIEMRLFERGVGPTPASGSGALAAIAACLKVGLIGNKGVANAPGGTQEFEIDPRGEMMRLYAPVRKVFSGDWEFGQA